MKTSIGKFFKRLSILMMFGVSSAFAYVAFLSSKQGEKLAGLLGPNIVEGAGCGVSSAGGSGSGSGSGTGTSSGTGTATASGTGSSSGG
jgi:hypothetical protein